MTVWTTFVWTTLTAPIGTTPVPGTTETWAVDAFNQFAAVGGGVKLLATVNNPITPSATPEIVSATQATLNSITVARGVSGVIQTHAIGDTLTITIDESLSDDGTIWVSQAYGFDLTGGTDNTVLLQAVIDSVPQIGTTQGGRIGFIPGSIIRIDGQLDLTRKQNLTFLGPSATGQNVVPAILRFTRTDNLPLIKVWSPVSIAFRGLWFETTSATFSGAVIDVKSV